MGEPYYGLCVLLELLFIIVSVGLLQQVWQEALKQKIYIKIEEEIREKCSGTTNKASLFFVFFSVLIYFSPKMKLENNPLLSIKKKKTSQYVFEVM